MAVLFRRNKEQLIPIQPHEAPPGAGVEVALQPPAEGTTPEQQLPAEQAAVQEAAPGSEHQPAARPAARPQLPTPTAPAAATVKSATRKEIEQVLSDGLVPMYQGMTAQEQARFRRTGEETAGAIEQLLGTFKATAKIVYQLIRAWLLLIPRVNKYFLEQETKLKTDRIMELQRQKKREDKLTHLV